MTSEELDDLGLVECDVCWAIVRWLYVDDHNKWHAAAAGTGEYDCYCGPNGGPHRHVSTAESESGAGT